MRHANRIPARKSKSSKSSGAHAAPIKVLLVEPHQMCRDALARLISEAAAFQIFASADTGTEAVRICRHSAPDVVVMATELDDADAMEVTAEILRVSQQTEVILLQRTRDEKVTLRAIQSGALGLVSTRAPALGLVEAIRTVAQGRSYVGPIALDAVGKRLASMGPPR
jgi:DNA-binding NarL/FixJ family response regulator